MNYAKQTYHQGNFTPTTEEHTTQRTIMPTTGGVFGMGTPSQRPQRSPKRPIQERTQRASANAILRNIFLPKYIEINEREFYNSLSKLTHYYKFTPTKSEHYPYPKNIHLAFKDAEEQLKQIKQENDIKLHLFKHPQKGCYLSVSEVYNTGMTLFYIPIEPLYFLLKSRKNKQLANLLLSVYSYYLRVINLPYYTEESDFLGYHYDILEEWIKEDFYNIEEREQQLAKLKQTKYIGEIIYHKIMNEKNLYFFKNRLNQFKPKTYHEKEFKNFAEEIYTLYKTYPKENIFRYDNYNPKKHDDYDIITIDKYIGFISNCDDWIFDQIVEMINNFLNECSEQIGPTIRRDFNAEFNTEFERKRNFYFENQIFNSIPKLYRLIHQF
ncbi:hypothetical protein ACQ1PL_04495 [Ornithobacterium rhinotracheale]